MRSSKDQVTKDRSLLKMLGKSEAVSFIHPNEEGLSEITISARDRTGLFADLTRVLTSEAFNIRQAQIFTTKNGYALDRFIVDTPRNVELKRERLTKRLEKGLQNRGKPDRKSRLPEKQKPFVPSDIVIDNKGSRKFTIIEVYGKDREGLLADLASALSTEKLSIHQAKIATEGERVADIFHATLANKGEKITSERKLKAIRKRLQGVLTQPS